MPPARIARDTPARQAGVRAHNLSLVLRQVAGSEQPVSRAGVAAATGLTRATVSTLVDELIAGQLLVEVAPPPRVGAGRPPIGLRCSPHGPAGLGLEINVDYLAAVVVDFTGAVRHREVRRADQRPRPSAEVLREVVELAGVADAAAGAAGLTVAGAALAVPGLVSPEGVVRAAPNLGWREVPVAALLRENGLDLHVDNEANLAALGELHAGDNPSDASFIYISGEIGIGAGIVLDGRLYRGARGASGELGHVTVRADGPRCSCGARGCLERYANQETILRRAGLPAAGPPSPDTAASQPPSADAALSRLAAQAHAGDQATLWALKEAGSALGVAAAGVVNLLDVDTVVLGGGYAPLSQWLIDPVRRELVDRVLTSDWMPLTVRACIWGADAAVVGAAGSVVRGIHHAPSDWLTRDRTGQSSR